MRDSRNPLGLIDFSLHQGPDAVGCGALAQSKGQAVWQGDHVQDVAREDERPRRVLIRQTPKSQHGLLKSDQDGIVVQVLMGEV